MELELMESQLNETKMSQLRNNCSKTGLIMPKSVASDQDLGDGNTSLSSQNTFFDFEESRRHITEAHENSGQTAVLYISIILSIYLLTIAFIGIRYALNRSYQKPFDFCWRCCDACQRAFTSSPDQDFTASSSISYHSPPPRQSHRRIQKSTFLSVEDQNVIEVTQTDEGLLETDL